MTLLAQPSIERKPSCTTRKPDRILALDLLRGLTIGFMILVNNPGDRNQAYWALRHSAWNGFTPTDLVFPTFLFLVGISVVLSTTSRVARGANRRSLFFHSLRRAAILFFLGLFVHSYPTFQFHTMRFYGVLPRIAICYFIVAVLYIFNPDWRSKAFLAVVALVSYWLLMRFVPVPGYGIPTRNIPLLDPYANLAAWLDRHIFSSSHLYMKTRDPEGFLSTIPAVATTLIGLLTGCWLRSSHTLVKKARGIALAGLTGVLLGGLWNFSFPINKKLWTSSFVLFAGGLSLLLLAFTIWIVDVYGAKRDEKNLNKPRRFFTILLVFGTNAIAAYVLAELLSSTIAHIHTGSGGSLQSALYQRVLGTVPDPAFASLLYSICFVAICWLVIWPLYSRKVFIKI